MSKQNVLGMALVAAVASLTIPVMPAMAQMKAPAKAPAAEPVAEPAQAPSAEAPETLEEAVETVAPLADEAAENLVTEPAATEILAAPATDASASTAVTGPSFSLPSVKLPFALRLSARPEWANMGGTGFAASPAVAGVSAPAQFNMPKMQTTGWTGDAEIGLGLLSIGGRLSNYGGFDKEFDPSLFAAGNPAPASAKLPYYWPENAWSAYVKAFGLRFGYLNEQFHSGISNGNNGAIGSLVGGIDSGFSILGLVGLDYHVLAGWGVQGQAVDGTTTSHIPAEAEASLYTNIGPVNLRLGYVARASFTGDPSAFLTVLTNPMSLASDETKRDTVNSTRLGTYMGPFFGAGFNF